MAELYSQRRLSTIKTATGVLADSSQSQRKNVLVAPQLLASSPIPHAACPRRNLILNLILIRQ
jgi:hypothetical protein